MTQKITHTFIKKGFIKVKIYFNLLEKINFYQCELTTTEYEEYQRIQETGVHGSP